MEVIYKKIEDIFDFQKKSKFRAGDGIIDGLYPFYTSSSELTKSINEFAYQGKSLVFGTGGKPSIHFARDKFSTSADCIVIQKKEDFDIDTEFCFYYLKTNFQILERGFKGAGLKHISKEYIKKIKIPIPYKDGKPDLLTQKRIAKVLSDAEKLIAKRKETIKLLDEFIKSTFLEMFWKNGDCLNLWSIDKIENYALPIKGSMRTGPFGSSLLHSEFTEKGDVKVLGIDNIANNFFEVGKPRYISKEKYLKLKRYTVFPNDVLISIMATNGKSAVVPENIPLSINTKHLAAITLNTKKILPFYLKYAFQYHPYILTQIKKNMKGAIMGGLNLTIIKNILLPQPPVDLQKQFTNIVTKQRTLKEKFNQSLKELENLYGSLSQKAFKGELELSKISIIDKLL